MSKLRDQLLGGLALMLFPASASIAQDSASAVADPPTDTAESSGEIIVEGYTEKQVRNFLWRAVIETGNVIAKRTDPICVGIDNAPAELAEPVKARIEANLDAFKIERAEPGCRANAIVVFDRNAHGFVNWLDKQNAGVAFGALFLPEKRRLIKPERPVYSWHVIKGAATNQFLGSPQPLSQQGASGSVGFQGAGFEPGGRLASSSLPADSQMTFSVVDTDAIDGITIEQLGDYLTMQMLVEFKPDLGEAVPPDSILNLFTPTGTDPDAAPEMSALDRTILNEIYGGRGSFRPGAVRASIARKSVERLDEAGALIEEP